MSYEPEALPPDFVEAFDRARARFGRLGAPVLFFSTTESTNDVASALATSGGPGSNAGAVVVADTQTAGRGRRGRSWFSPPGAGLYVSVVLDPGRASQEPDRALALLTLAAGVALADAVYRTTGLAPDIKWPNDLLIGRRKLAGILAEGITSGPEVRLKPDATLVDARVTRVVPGNTGSMSHRRRIRRSWAIAPRRWNPSSDVGSIARRSAPKRWRRWRRGTTTCSPAGSMLFSTRGMLPALRAAAARVQWETPEGSQSGTTAGVDDRGRCSCAWARALVRLVAGEVVWI